MNSIKKQNSTLTGFTLIELIVAFGLFSIIMAVASGGFVQVIRSYRIATALTATNDSMALTMEQVAREMRTGYNFCEIADLVKNGEHHRSQGIEKIKDLKSKMNYRTTGLA